MNPCEYCEYDPDTCERDPEECMAEMIEEYKSGSSERF